MAPVTMTLVIHSSIWREGTKIIIHLLLKLQKTQGKCTVSHSYCNHHHTKWHKLLFSAPVLGEQWLLCAGFKRENLISLNCFILLLLSVPDQHMTKKGNGTRKCYTVRIYTAWCHQPLQHIRARLLRCGCWLTVMVTEERVVIYGAMTLHTSENNKKSMRSGNWCVEKCTQKENLTKSW